MFALFATGLSLSFGVMRLVNLAHGDLIILAAFQGVRPGDGIALAGILMAIRTNVTPTVGPARPARAVQGAFPQATRAPFRRCREAHLTLRATGDRLAA